MRDNNDLRRDLEYLAAPLGSPAMFALADLCREDLLGRSPLRDLFNGIIYSYLDKLVVYGLYDRESFRPQTTKLNHSQKTRM